MQINITLRDMISAKDTGEFDEETGSNIWAVYFLGIEIARELEPWGLYQGPESLLIDKYEEILRVKVISALGLKETS